MDTLTPAQRSERMARIRSKNTKAELAVRSIVHRMGYRFRIHRSDLPGSPDLVFPSLKKAIFVHGCFWHAHAGCATANRPKTRSAYWDAKFTKNRQRDRRNASALRRAGWSVATIWECEAKSVTFVCKKVARFLGPTKVNE